MVRIVVQYHGGPWWRMKTNSAKNIDIESKLPALSIMVYHGGPWWCMKINPETKNRNEKKQYMKCRRGVSWCTMVMHENQL